MTFIEVSTKSLFTAFCKEQLPKCKFKANLE